MESQELPKPIESHESALSNQEAGQEVISDKSSSIKLEKTPTSLGSPAIDGSIVDDASNQVSSAVVNNNDDNDSDNGVVDPLTIDVAEDIDLIEKKWVNLAKDIVTQTQGDPYKQNKEISKIKAQYIKKRYNKDIKVKDE